MWTFALIFMMLIALPAMTSAQERGWGETMAARAWITAFLDTSVPRAVPQPLDRLIVKSGLTERTIYQAGPNDINLGEPVVSRDGQRLAFAKVESEDTGLKSYLYMLELATGEFRRLAELHPPGIPLRGAAVRGTQLAWSHDGATLLFFGQARALGASNTWNTVPHELMIIDVATRILTRLVPRGPAPSRQGRAITSQAWAPDNRRIVYAGADEHLIMIDLVTLSETPLGAGTDATWSPDGQWLAARVRKGKNIGDADYVLIAANSPNARELLTDAAPPTHLPSFFSGSRAFVGPAIWSPDSRSLILWRLGRGEREEPYVKASAGTSLERLPDRYRIKSLGGQP